MNVRRNWAALVILILGLSVSIVSHEIVRRNDRARNGDEFDAHVTETLWAIQSEADDQMFALRALQSLFSSSERVERDELSRFAAALLQNPQSDMASIMWLPKVAPTEREEFESVLSSETSALFHIHRRGDNGRALPVRPERTCFPITHIEPFRAEAADALGRDLASDPFYAGVLKRAGDTGGMIATGPLPSDPASEHNFQIVFPIYDATALPENIEQRRANLAGYIVTTMRAADLVDNALRRLTMRGMDVSLYSRARGASPQIVYFSKSRSHAPSVSDAEVQAIPPVDGLRKRVDFEMAGQPWVLDVKAAPYFVQSRRNHAASSLLIGGMILSVMISLLVRSYIRRVERDKHQAHVLTEVNRDLSEQMARRKEAESKLVLSDRVFENSGEAIMITDADNNILSVNDAFSAMTGYDRDEIVGQNPRVLKSDRHDEIFYAEMWSAIRGAGNWQGEIWNRRKNGETFPQWLTISTIRDEDGQIANYIAVSSDMTNRKAADERIRFLAYYDGLTRLPNRTLLRDRLRQATAEAARSGRMTALMFIDLDRFKNINDSLGHRAGDLLLQAVGERLSSLMRKADTVSRTGGDEFVIVLPKLADVQQASHVASRISQALSQPFDVDGRELTIGGSVGIAVYPQDGEDIDTLMKNADAAMYHCKESGGQRYQYFTEDMNVVANRRIEIESGLRKALRDEDFELFFQPQVECRSGQIIGAEALIRWRHPEKGYISPGQFIPIAEESDLVVEIGTWVLGEACRINRQWQSRQHLRRIPVSVNISAMQVRQENFHDCVMDALHRNHLGPEYLELELTESSLIRRPEETGKLLKRLKSSGLTLAIDDFGTGYCSLSYLKRFELDRLKIDQSFVRDLHADIDSTSIVVAIIQMARSLGMKTIAEGVEVPEQAAFLREHGCDEIQGFLFGRPMPADQFRLLLEPHRTSAAGPARTGANR